MVGPVDDIGLDKAEVLRTVSLVERSKGDADHLVVDSESVDKEIDLCAGVDSVGVLFDENKNVGSIALAT